MGSMLDSPEHMTIDRYASLSVPKDMIPMEFTIPNNAEHELIFPLDSAGNPVGANSIVILSTIPIYFSFVAGGTLVAQAPNTAYSAQTRFFCQDVFPLTTRQRRTKIYVKNVTPGSTGLIRFILSI